MRKVKVSKSALINKNSRSKEWPVVVYVWIIGLAMFGYLIGRIGLNAYPHPYHWLSGVAGGLTGIPIGWLWYRWRGDVF